MGRFSVFGEGIPGIDPQELRGNLIVIEGADGVGRSTQIWLLKQWLETKGHAVLATRMQRSALAGKGLRQAKKGTTLGRAVGVRASACSGEADGQSRVWHAGRALRP